LNSIQNPFDNEVLEYEAWFCENDQLLRSELDAIRPLIPAAGKGIEIGVGTGIFASNLGIEYGVEPSGNMGAEAIKKGIQVIKAVAEDLPIADHSYDFAMMVTVDCFLSDVTKAFSEAHRIIKPKGILIIAFLDRATELGMIYEQNKHLHKTYANADFHSAKEIASLLKETGFCIEEQRQTIFSLENKKQAVKDGTGEGLFAVIKAQKC
jgi:ubiquinone/menaquinone biosynthesis C-methylase UbiE